MVRYVCRWSLCLSLDMVFCFNIHIGKKSYLLCYFKNMQQIILLKSQSAVESWSLSTV